MLRTLKQGMASYWSTVPSTVGLTLRKKKKNRFSRNEQKGEETLFCYSTSLMRPAVSFKFSLCDSLRPRKQKLKVRLLEIPDE